MSFLISEAHAQAGGAASGGAPFADIIFIIALGLVFYFLLIRPQQKRTKEHRKLVEELTKGDEVVTNGGLVGRITKVGDSFLTVEVAGNTEVLVQRMAVSAVLPKGTIKSL